MTELVEHITVNPVQYGGRPCIRRMQIRVVDMLDLLTAGLSQQQILEGLPGLEERLPDLEVEDICRPEVHQPSTQSSHSHSAKI